jgi:hypothetical protein
VNASRFAVSIAHVRVYLCAVFQLI